jgi:hypothetical protein
MTNLETLVAELKAIECWDAHYYRHETQDKQAVLAFNSRQERRRVIVELLRSRTNSPDCEVQSCFIRAKIRHES